MNLALAIVYIATGLFATLTGFSVLHPYKNRPEKRAHINQYRNLYRYGGMIFIAYGIYRLTLYV